MITEDQSAVVGFLASPSTHGGASVEQIDTHSAVVFLAEQRAYKLKRAVRYDYLDFSTVERRRAMCDAEVRLNRRTAPSLYRGVMSISREEGGALALGGPGKPVDWVVDMNRFPQEELFDRLAATDRLELASMPPLAIAIAEFHAAAERRPDHGGKSGMAWVIDGNAEGFAEYGGNVLDTVVYRRLTERAGIELDARAALLDEQRASGLVRQCHGDLHLRNIVLLDGQPTLFDGVEFNDQIACTDVLYDLAFLLMDPCRRRLPRHANAVWNTYLAATGDLKESHCSRCSSRAGRRSARRRARRQHGCSTKPNVAQNSRTWHVHTSAWLRTSCAVVGHPWWRSADSQVPASRRWRKPWRHPSAPSLERS
jgi:aminoglycoside phosphotransferase family enzyme